MRNEDFEQRVTRVAALAEPIRRALYRYVVAQPDAVSREQAANAVGVARHAAKFHLDKLEEDGLLDVEFRRPPGRRGPGAGRPAKHYKRANREIEVTLPERRYALAGQVMAKAIAAAKSSSAPVSEALATAARATGREIGNAVRGRAGRRTGTKAVAHAVADVLAEHGYEPHLTGTTITMANCPFHALAQEHTELVCGMNLDLMLGMLDGLSSTSLRAELAPAPGRCCVTITAT